MRTTYKYDPDLDCVVKVGGNFFEEKGRAPNVISDDIGAGVSGLRAMHRMDKRRFDSKSGMRRDAAEMGLVPVGDDTNYASRQPEHTEREYQGMVNDARQQIEGNYRGTREWLERSRESGRTMPWKDR